MKSSIRSYRSAENPCSNSRPTSSYMRRSSSSRADSGWSWYERTNGCPSCFLHPGTMSILFAATTNGVLYRRRMFRLSIVCGRNPSLTSMTRTARSASAPPRARKVEKATWPGVSMNRRPGMRNDRPLTRSPHISRIAARGTSVAPMCCVMPPASRPATPVPRIRSRRVVLPWSTCPRTDTMGWRMEAIADGPRIRRY